MTAHRMAGDTLADIRTTVPGPRSRELAHRLSRVESRNVTRIHEDGPIFWEAAAGANVRDVDGNTYIDLTAGFGVAHAGHANARVAAAISEQAARLPHALGDVYPADVKAALLEKLASIAPAGLAVAILASAGGEAVEAALKTAVLRTGRSGILAFERAYHGLTYGALAVTARSDFRSPFQKQMFAGVRFAPYPSASDGNAAVDDAIARAHTLLGELEQAGTPAGAVIVEPIQGRGGLIVPPPEFLQRLRGLCDGRSTLLIFDEIYTGMGRTGRWFACEHSRVTPDIITVGKALTGSLPLSAAIGRPDIMAAWPPSSGEAIHTSTFLGNPVACAAALAQIDEVETRHLLDRATALGHRISSRTAEWRRRFSTVRDCRGIGLLQGVELQPGLALEVAAEALQKGILILAEGEHSEVLAITPPAVITEAQLDLALDVLEGALARRAL
jgi:4-aminobutyrate aminotransferase-like enzyme